MSWQSEIEKLKFNLEYTFGSDLTNSISDSHYRRFEPHSFIRSLNLHRLFSSFFGRCNVQGSLETFMTLPHRPMHLFRTVSSVSLKSGDV